MTRALTHCVGYRTFSLGSIGRFDDLGNLYLAPIFRLSGHCGSTGGASCVLFFRRSQSIHLSYDHFDDPHPLVDVGYSIGRHHKMVPSG